MWQNRRHPAHRDHKNFAIKTPPIGCVSLTSGASRNAPSSLGLPRWGFVLAALMLCFTMLSQQQAMAKPALVYDLKSDLILYSEEPDRLWHPASLTKLMTAYLVFEALKNKKITLESELVNSAMARAQPPSKIGLPPSARLKVKKAIEILIVKSANDVAVMLAEKVGGSVTQFVRYMNQTARRLGMRSSKFYNPHGLPHQGQVTTARDMGILAKSLIRDFPEYNYIFSLGSVKVGKRRMRSHNDLLRTYSGTDGMKTGFICASGFNVVASATRNGRRVIAVVLGARTPLIRRKRAMELFDYAFTNYWWKTLFPLNFSNVAVGSNVKTGPVNLRKVVCNYRPRKAKKKYVKRKAKPKKKKK